MSSACPFPSCSAHRNPGVQSQHCRPQGQAELQQWPSCHLKQSSKIKPRCWQASPSPAFPREQMYADINPCHWKPRLAPGPKSTTPWPPERSQAAAVRAAQVPRWHWRPGLHAGKGGRWGEREACPSSPGLLGPGGQLSSFIPTPPWAWYHICEMQSWDCLLSSPC